MQISMDAQCAVVIVSLNPTCASLRYMFTRYELQHCSYIQGPVLVDSRAGAP